MSGIFDDVTLVVQRPRRTVRNGSVYETWTDPVEHVVGPGSLDAGDTSEEHERADSSTVEFTWYGPLDADVHEHDRVRFAYAGETYLDYQVEGRPKPMDDSGFGLVAHRVVRLRKREG